MPAMHRPLHTCPSPARRGGHAHSGSGGRRLRPGRVLPHGRDRRDDARRACSLCRDAAGDLAIATCGTSAFADEHPAHPVEVSAFWIDRTEITNGQYARCVDVGACAPPWKSAPSLARATSASRPSRTTRSCRSIGPGGGVLQVGRCAPPTRPSGSTPAWPEDRLFPWADRRDDTANTARSCAG